MSVCSFLGEESKVEGSNCIPSYVCNHPKVMWTVQERCNFCPFKTFDSVVLEEKEEEDSPLDTLPRDPKGLMKRRPPQQLGHDTAPDTIVNRDCKPAHMGNLFYGSSVFMVLGGPSLNKLNLDLLKNRGVCTLAVNNSATVVRPNLWIHGDPPEKFHSMIWDDPAILKFIPVREYGKHRRISGPTGEPIHPVSFANGNAEVMFKYLARNSPGVFGYQRHSDFNPDTFLKETAICWGNSKKSAERNGRPHVLNIMFAALKLSYYLGFRQVYLLGCDFDMHPGNVYCFDERKDPGAMDSNNGTYRKLMLMFSWLKPKFDEAGFKIFNCNPESKLTVFPFMSFEESINASTTAFRSKVQTAGWYQKSQR